jgi:phage/plasmid-associated DNA primase
VVPFSQFFPAGRADVRLIDRLTRPGDLQGLLRMAVGGLQQVMRRGVFALPPSVINATADFKKSADPMRGFLEERIESRHPMNTEFVARTDIYNAYTTWAAQNGFMQVSAQRFYEGFAMAAVDGLEFPVKSITRDGVNGYKGIAIR